MDGDPARGCSARDRARALIEQHPPAQGQGVVEWLNRLCGVLAREVSVLAVTVIVGAPADENSAVVAANEPVYQRHAETDFGVGEGPSQDAWAYGRPVLVSELGVSHDGAWPGYTVTAAASGIRAAHAFPLQIGAARIGVLTVYDDQPRQLTSPELATCLTMAELATQGLFNYSAPTLAGKVDPDLREPINFRSEIYQAQGMVAVSLDMGLADALSRIRGHAFLSGRDLIDVAVDIVHHGLQLDDNGSDSQHGSQDDDTDEGT